MTQTYNGKTILGTTEIEVSKLENPNISDIEIDYLLNNINKLLSLNIKEPSRTIDILLDGDDYLYSGDVLNILHHQI